MACVVKGRFVDPAGGPVRGVLRLTPVRRTPGGLSFPVPPYPVRRYGVEASTPGDVVGVPLVVRTGADGVVDVAVRVPPEEGLTWVARAQTADGERREIAVREGLVLPRDGVVSLAWVLGLAVDPAVPQPPAGGRVVVSADGGTYVFSAPVVSVDGALGTFELVHDTVVDNGDGTFTVEGSQE